MTDMADRTLPDMRTLPFPALRVEPPWAQPTADRALTDEYLARTGAALERGRTEFRLGHYRDVATGAQDLLVRLRRRLDAAEGTCEQVERGARIAGSAATLVGRTRRVLDDAERAPEAFETAVELFERANPDTFSPGELTDYGIALAAQDRRDEAIQRLREAIDHGGDAPEALRHLGRLLLADYESEAAEAVLRRAVDASPDDPTSRGLLARVLLERGRRNDAGSAFEQAGFGLLRQGRLAEAEEAFDAAIALDGETAMIHAGRAEVRRRRGRPRDALAAIEHALEIDSGLAWAWACRTAALIELGDLDGALNAVDHAVLHEPQYAAAHELRGRLLRMRGQYEQAVEALETALELEPTLLGAFVDLGAALFGVGRPDDAVRVLREGLAQAPDVPWFKAAVGEAFRIGGHLDEAVGLLRGAVEADPTLAHAGVGLADALSARGESGDVAAANQALDGSVAGVGDSGASARRTAQLLRDLGRPREAEALARRAIDLKPRSVSARLELAEILDRLRRPDEALETLDAALELRPDDARVLVRKGRLLQAQGRLTAATKALEAALARGRSFDALIDLGRARWRLGENDRALAAINEALEVQPRSSSALALRAAVHVTVRQQDPGLELLEAAENAGMLDGFGLATRARALLERGDRETGESVLRQALDSPPQDVESIGELGDVLRRFGRTDDALQQLDRALELAPHSAWVLAMKGQALAERGDLDGAVGRLERAVRSEPRLAWAQAALGEILRLRGDNSAALRALDATLELDPGYEWALASRGATLHSLRRYPEAIASLEEAVRIDERDWFAHVELASVLADAGAFEAALARVDASLEIGSHHWSLGLRGWILQNLGRKRAADSLHAYLESRRLSGDEVWCARGIGDSLMLLRKREAAHAEYRRAIDSAPPAGEIDPGMLAAIGWCHYAVGEPDMAVRVHNEVLYRDPGMIETEFDLGLALFAGGRCGHGQRQIERALTHLELLDPLRRHGVLRVAKTDVREAMDEQRVPERCSGALEDAYKQVRSALRRARPPAAALLLELCADTLEAGVWPR